MAADLYCPGPLATRLNYLYEHVRDPITGRRFTDRHVSAAINQTAGTKIISGGTLHYLRKGDRQSRPRQRTLMAIADFFNVPADYFEDPATVARVSSHIDVLTAVADPRVYNIAIKSVGQHPKVLDAVLEILDQARGSTAPVPERLAAVIVQHSGEPSVADLEPDRWQRAPYDQIRCNDLRLIRIVGGGLFAFGNAAIADAVRQDHTIELLLDQHAAALNTWAGLTASATLDDLALDLLELWQRYRPLLGDHSGAYPTPQRTSRPVLPRMLPAVIARLGLGGQPPLSLSGSAARVTATRERVRQVTWQIEAAAQTWVWAPTIDQALTLADSPITMEQFAQQLIDRGLAGRNWHPQAVESLARLCGRVPHIHLDQQRTDKVIVDTAVTLINVKDIITLDDLTHALHEAAVNADPEQIKIAVSSSRRLLAAWPWITLSSATGHRARLHRAVKGMLSIAGPLSTEILSAGLTRRRAGKMLNDSLPAPQALTALLNADPIYVVKAEDGTASIGLRVPLAPDQIYPQDSCAYKLIAHLQQAPGNIGTRQELTQVAIDSGFTRHAAGRILSMHEAFAAWRPDEWTLVGRPVVEAGG